MSRAVYIITVQPLPGTDPARALRWALKAMLHSFGLRCIDIAERKP